MARIVGYIAASLDGYIADHAESLKWLSERTDLELGEFHYDNFIRRIRTLLMGRATYDWLAQQGTDWPYGAQRCYVVTSSPVDNPAGPLETRADINGLIAELRALDDGDVWMLGGGRLQMEFMERGALDELEIYLISHLLGGGRPLFPPTGFERSLTLLSATPLGKGCARLHYSLE